MEQKDVHAERELLLNRLYEASITLAELEKLQADADKYKEGITALTAEAGNKRNKRVWIGLYMLAAGVGAFVALILQPQLNRDFGSLFEITWQVLLMGMLAGLLFCCISHLISYQNGLRRSRKYDNYLKANSATLLANYEAKIRKLSNFQRSEKVLEMKFLIPEDYRSYNTVNQLYKFVENRRADTLKEAINLFEGLNRVAKEKKEGGGYPLAVAGLALSLLSMFIPLAGLVAIVGITLSVTGYVQMKNSEQKGSFTAIAGLILGAVSLMYTIYLFSTVNRALQDLLRYF